MKKSLLLIFVFIHAFSLRAQDIDGKKGLNIWFDKPTELTGMQSWYNLTTDKNWEANSLMIGNGSFGANILGSISAERLTLNEKSLWTGGPNSVKNPSDYWNVNKESAKFLPEIRKAFEEGDFEKAGKITADHFNGLVPYETGDEDPFRFGTYTSLGEAYIETGHNEVRLSDYKRVLSLDSALVTVSYQKNGVRFTRKYYMSYPDSVMVIHYIADKPGMQNLTFSWQSTPYMEATSEMENNQMLYKGHLKNNNEAFALRVSPVINGGETQLKEGKIIIKNANDVYFFLTADTDYQVNYNPDFSNPTTYVGVNPINSTAAMMRNVLNKSTDELWKRHIADYQNLFNRVELHLNPQVARTDIPTYRRLLNLKTNDRSDFYLEELYYQFGRYLLIASSREGTMPANLQGIWSNGVDGPWHMDYHNNINIQMNYWPASSTNLNECFPPLVEFIKSQIKPGEKVAQSYWNARGWTTSISSNIYGFASPVTSKDMQWNLCPMAGPWLATHIWDYYDYTRDKSFLKNTGYEILKGAANFTVDFLWHRPDGSYTAAPSTSPEHGGVDMGATFVHAVAKEILTDAIEAARILSVDKKEQKQWQEVLNHIVPYQIGRYGQLMEWSRDIDDPKDEHRHVNHLYGLHPGHTLSPITTPELAEAAKVVLVHRGDGATGWSMGWKLNQWARLLDGNHSYILYKNLLKNGTTNNLWDIHPPFQIDGNFGGTAGITEMLLQSHIGFIHLLPALPDAWADGSVKGLCARGNFEIAIDWKNCQLQKAVILSKSGMPCSIRYKNETLNFKTKKGQRYIITEESGKLVCKQLFVRTAKDEQALRPHIEQQIDNT
ncbi:glycoside hydrolase N-terminal domain-containing protein [Bacteroidaceae bacterium 14-104]|nr:glycoside hydrolase N-terminal domain-containing protein [Phocaeicola oris]MCE2616131.1 glycoside hydrolase N-terminal domain-containing protein [Phocaeicola oris]